MIGARLTVGEAGQRTRDLFVLTHAVATTGGPIFRREADASLVKSSAHSLLAQGLGPRFASE